MCLTYARHQRSAFHNALKWYGECLRVRPGCASTLTALGLTYHTSALRFLDVERTRRLDEAIEAYHAALGAAPDDSLTATLLSAALEDALTFGRDDGVGGARALLPIPHANYAVSSGGDDDVGGGGIDVDNGEGGRGFDADVGAGEAGVDDAILAAEAAMSRLRNL